MSQMIATSKMSVIVGLGLTGRSVARYLSRNDRRFTIVDSRLDPPGLREFKYEFPAISVELGELKAEQFEYADEIILSPGVAREEPVIASLIEKGTSVIGDIELFARAVNVPIIAITGSNGKSTVTSLVGKMADNAGIKVAVGGNLGIPALELISDDVELYVLELSSFQLESTYSLEARSACILNITPDHLDRYNSIQEYHQAKHRIYRGAKSIVYNREDSLTRPLLAEGVHAISFGASSPDLNDFGIRDETMLSHGLNQLIAADELKIKGKHNIANALAALAIGHTVGIATEPMLNTLKQFPGLPHRCEFIASKNGISYYNDSKATNVGATVAALQGMGGENLILIVGGDAKGVDLDELKAPLIGFTKAIVTLGKDGQKIGDLVRDRKPVFDEDNLVSAVGKARELANAGDLILLSPACASLDMFSNYQERGQKFIAAVEGL